MTILSPIGKQRRSCMLFLFVILGILVLAGAGFIAFFSYHPDDQASVPGTSLGIGIIHEPNNENIGISDGNYAFDTNRIDGDLKLQGSEEFNKGNKIGAVSLWREAVAKDTGDAEALIYLEDQHVLGTGSPYITLIVGTMLTGDTSAISAGRDMLQGAYVAQKEYNDGLKLGQGELIRLLVASSGSKADYTTIVAQQIVNAANQHKTIVGVMGWPFSSYALKAIEVLANAHIPMVSPTASSDLLTGKSRFFFRVVPPNKRQAIVGARYAEQQLHARQIALFVDPNDAYSNSLANDFSQQFIADGNRIVATERYKVGRRDNLPTLLQQALAVNPDLIYFAGYSDDLSVLLTNLLTSRPYLYVMGGDALYELGGYTSSGQASFSRLRFTAFAYPDEWDILGLSGQKPSFFSEYPADFNPSGLPPARPYGLTRADNDVILSYDATLALLKACINILDEAKITLTPDAVQQGLTMITGDQAFQGVSGKISFGLNGDPVDKAIVVLYVDPTGHIKLLEQNGVQGCFLVRQC